VLRRYYLDLLATKDLGAPAGLESKLAAAAALQVPTVVVSRPQVTRSSLCNEPRAGGADRHSPDGRRCEAWMRSHDASAKIW
jgi:Precorrin-6x reductase CbiJ/CobK